MFVVALCAGCGSAVHLAPVDLSQPGWRSQPGQAVWKPPGARPEIAGDLLLATNVNGDFFVQFSKTPFTVATAESSGGRWQIQFGVHEYHRSGRGAPPDRFAWFELPRALAGLPASPRWRFARGPDGQWRLENTRSGETLEGRFFP
jgi:hypothetical protein